ncbi:MAG: ParB/RepB/Spo0J family partition protein [Alistipes sp.]|nr:ParB/RepB/Spo0J family partition protein [Alistipes sp.]
MKQKGLGRGLDALFGGNIEVKTKPMEAMTEIRISDIEPNPTQPRTQFDEEALEELAESIRQLGLIQPITVKRNGEKYIIISGERRWRAAEKAGIEVVPAYIREVDDTTLHAMALVENIQREDLNAIEISLGMQRLVEECGLTQEALAERLGKKRSTVANYLRLLNLPEEIQFAIKGGIISMGHAKAIASAESKTKQLSLLKRCVKNNLSVRQLEELVRLASEKRTKVAPAVDEEYPESYSRLVEHLEKLFSQDIAIKRGKNGGGKIIIDFASDKDIEKFISRLSK